MKVQGSWDAQVPKHGHTMAWTAGDMGMRVFALQGHRVGRVAARPKGWVSSLER